MSAFKVREVIDLIRGEEVGRAAEILEFCERGPAELVGKVLASAVANAAHNDELDPEELYVSACYADEAKTMRRMRPRARGRASRIRKRSAHITIIVSRLPEDRLARLRAKRAAEQAARRSRRGRGAAPSRARRRRRTAAEAPAEELAATVHDHDHDEDAAEFEASEAEEFEGEEFAAEEAEAEEEEEAAAAEAEAEQEEEAAAAEAEAEEEDEAAESEAEEEDETVAGEEVEAKDAEVEDTGAHEPEEPAAKADSEEGAE
jgi:large subunit ribosomal protein L22